MNDNQRVLFVTHDAGRTGAPLILLNFLRWLRRNHPEVDSDVLFRQGGVLEKEFCESSSLCLHVNNRLVEFFDKHRLWGKNRSRIIKYIRINSLLRRIRSRNYKCIYVNTIANSDIVPHLAKFTKCPIICHVHELESVVESYGRLEVESALAYCSRFIAPSDLVKNYMEENLAIDPEKIVKIPGFIRFDGTPPNKTSCRRHLDIDDDVFVVCGSGTIDWRKGTDLFLQILNQVKKTAGSKILFIWVGGDLESRYYKELLFDQKKLGIQSKILFTGTVANPQQYYAASDLFALTSREDPFPLVALEAASLGLPIICFDSAVGSTEFINDETGRVVPYLGVSEFSEAILELIIKPEELKKISMNIKAASVRYEMEPICGNIFSIISDALQQHRAVTEN